MHRPKRPALRKRVRIHPGAPPGTLVLDPSSPKPRLTVIAYNSEEFIEQEITDLKPIHDALERWPVTWVNVDGLGDVDAIREVGDLFGVHGLALEDVLNVHQRPKVDEYGNLLFIVARMIEPGHPVQAEQMSMFLGERFVLTFQEHVGDCLDCVRKRIRDGRGKVREMGADYLAYCLLDAVIDGYFPYLDNLSDLLENLEDDVIARPTTETVAKIHQVKRDLLTVRRAIGPLREAVNTLLRNAHPRITEATQVYIRDCYDHTIQIADLIESYRELAGGLLDVYLSSVSNRMNEVMKVLTVIATMFIPLTFLAGIYGMNFDPDASPWNMPELRSHWGYPIFIVAMLLIALVEIFLFWRKGWLGGSDGASDGRLDRTCGHSGETEP